MGCCLSAADHNPETEGRHSIDGAPPTSPPGVIEEETVKEVLLEIPVVSKTDERIKGMPPENREWKAEAAPTPVIHGNSDPPRKDHEEIVSEVSEASEMCSYSESFSNAAPEKRDDDEDGVVNQRPPPRKRRAHGGGRGRGERVVARRMAAPSPEKRGQVAPLRPVRGRPVAGQPRDVAEENGRRRDAGEGFGGRSRSPVKHGESGARRDVSDEKTPVTEESPNGEVGERRNVSDEKTAATGESPHDVVSAEEAESLENPVVSLECFIFL